MKSNNMVIVPRHVARAATVPAEQDQARRQFQAERDLAEIAEQINAAHAGAHLAFAAGIDRAIEAGNLLLKAKAHLGHGGWSDWLNKNVKFSSRTVRRYMQLAKCQERLAPKRPDMASLSITEAIASISSQQHRIARLPAPVVAEAIDESPRDDERLRETVARAESAQRHRERLERQEQDAAEKRAYREKHGEVIQPEPVPFEKTLSVSERDFVFMVKTAITKLVAAKSGLSPARILDLFNEAGCQALGGRWDQ